MHDYMWFFQVGVSRVRVCDCVCVRYELHNVQCAVCVLSRRRALNRKKAAQLLMEGKRSEARDCLAQCIDITPQMALELINVSFIILANCFFLYR